MNDLNNNGHQFHQYQHNEQSHLILTDNKTNDNDVENQVPGLDMYNTVVMFFYSQEDIT